MPITNHPKKVIQIIEQSHILTHKIDATENEILWYRKTFDTPIRHLEYLIEPLVLVNAQRIADTNRLGDLRLQRYRTPKAWPGGEELYWEHAKPVSDIRRSLMQLGDKPTAEDVLAIINKAEIAWITRSEERPLSKTGRCDWHNEYLINGINLTNKKAET